MIWKQITEVSLWYFTSMSNEHIKSNIYGRWDDWSNQSYPNVWCPSASYLKMDSPRSGRWNEAVRASSLGVTPGGTRKDTCTRDSKGREANIVHFWIHDSCGTVWLSLTREIWVAMCSMLPGHERAGVFTYQLLSLVESYFWGLLGTVNTSGSQREPSGKERQVLTVGNPGVSGHTHAERMWAEHRQSPYASWCIWLSLKRRNVFPWR